MGDLSRKVAEKEKQTHKNRFVVLSCCCRMEEKKLDE
jgi:hypothetical protein